MKPQRQDIIPGVILVKFKDHLDEKHTKSKLDKCRVKSKEKKSCCFKLQVEEDEVEALMDQLRSDPDVEWVNEDKNLYPTVMPNDPLFNQDPSGNWAFQEYGTFAPWGWDISVGDASIGIGIVDSGVYGAHPDLNVNGKLVAAVNTTDNGRSPYAPVYFHGTSVASAAAAAGNNNEGTVGVSWNASIYTAMAGETMFALSDTAEAIDWLAAQPGVRVINLSLGGPPLSVVTQADIAAFEPVTTAIANAWAAGKIIVAGAGNSGHGHFKIVYNLPAALPNVLAVGATNEQDNIAVFSTPSADVCAPGDTYYMATLPEAANNYAQYGLTFGTSFASPYIVGVLANILAVNPALTNQQAIDILLSTADTFTFAGSGGKRVNIPKALLAANKTLAVGQHITGFFRAKGHAKRYNVITETFSPFIKQRWIAVTSTKWNGSSGWVWHRLGMEENPLNSGRLPLLCASGSSRWIWVPIKHIPAGTLTVNYYDATANHAAFKIAIDRSVVYTDIGGVTGNKTANLSVTEGSHEVFFTFHEDDDEAYLEGEIYIQSVVFTPNDLVNDVRLEVDIASSETITKVEFYANTTLLGESLSYPYTLNTQYAAVESTDVTAKVYVDGATHVVPLDVAGIYPTTYAGVSTSGATAGTSSITSAVLRDATATTSSSQSTAAVSNVTALADTNAEGTLISADATSSSTQITASATQNVTATLSKAIASSTISSITATFTANRSVILSSAASTSTVTSVASTFSSNYTASLSSIIGTSAAAAITTTASATVTAEIAPAAALSGTTGLTAAVIQAGTGKIRDSAGREIKMYFWTGTQLQEYQITQ